jgi:hypothetical protein
MRISAKSKKPQFWSVQETLVSLGQEAGRGRGPEKANRQGVGASFSCFCSNFRTGPKCRAGPEAKIFIL